MVLDERVQGEEGVTVRKGQLLRIHGTIAPTPVPRDDLTGEDRAALQDDPIYLQVDRAEVLAGS